MQSFEIVRTACDIRVSSCLAEHVVSTLYWVMSRCMDGVAAFCARVSQLPLPVD